MAIFSLSANMISRSAGKSAVGSAAYISAEKLKDERQEMLFDYRSKQDVVHSEIMLPDVENLPAWAGDREKLWNQVEAAENRKDSQTARQIRISLPLELSQEQNIALTREFVQKNYVDFGLAADVNIHAKAGNPHAHIMLTTRTIGPEGFNPRKFTEFNRKTALMEWRKSWEEHANYHLAKAGHEARIDHRSYADRGIDLEPQHKIGVGFHNRHRTALDRFADHQRIARENGERIKQDPNIALDYISRQQAVFGEYDILKLAHRQSADVIQFREVTRAIMESEEIVKLGPDKNGRERFTTVQTLDIEKNMLTRGMDMAQHPRHPVKQRFVRQAQATRTLTTDQQTAFKHIMTSGDLCCVVGYAGSGKSYTLGAVREAYEAQGYRVTGTALAGIAAEGLQRESGIESRTIARLMIDIENQRERLGRKDILIVDESGMVATRQMNRLIEYAHQGGAKVVLVGSGQQLQPIEAGGPFKAFYERIGGAEMTGIRRQHTDWQKECTKQLEGTQAGLALETYRDKERIHGHDTTDEAVKAIVSQWRTAQKHGSCVAVAFRNVDVEKINQAIRAEAKEMGKLRGKEREFWTPKGQRSFAAGDRIVFLKNNPQIGVMNGNFGDIERIRRTTLQVRLDDGTRIAFNTKDYAHINHGYAATTHKLQGATVDRTMVLADPYFDRHAALVALSRHREDVSMHWSKESFKDFDQLKAALTRERPKELAHDFGKEIHGSKRTHVSGKLDRRTDRTVDGHSGGLDRSNQRGPGGTPKGDGIEKPAGRRDAGIASQERGRVGPADGLQNQQAGQHRGQLRSEERRDVLSHGPDGGHGSAGRIRAMGVSIFRHGRSYEVVRDKLQEAAAGSPRDVRREVGAGSRNKDEIERFKIEINLVEYAQAHGYTVDRRESSINSKIMRHDNGDKIVVATDKDRHGIYFSVRNTQDNGTIVDFVQRRRGMNLGEARGELRPWIGLGRAPQRPARPHPKPIPTHDLDAQKMPWAFARTTPVERQAYLESRGITPETLQDGRFKGMVREDQRGNVVFPHYGNGALTGYEVKNDRFTGFSKGGEKGLWTSNNLATAREIMITESAIDALSHAQMAKSGRDTAYISIGGQIGKQQERLISSVMARAQRSGAQITIGTDNDRAGDELANKLQDLAPEEARLKRVVPAEGKDFNELLQHVIEMQQDRGMERDRGGGMEMGR